MRKKQRKPNKAAGFTLAETLLAILILLMVSGIVAAGIPVAKNAYEKVVLASNAEVMMSTTISALRNELVTAQNIKTSDDTVVTYYNTNRGTTAKLYTDPAAGIMLQRYYSDEGFVPSYSPAAERLISTVEAAAKLYVTYSKVTYADGILTFENLSVKSAAGATPLSTRDTLSIRVISG